MPPSPSALLQLPGSTRWQAFERPVEVLEAHDIEAVPSLLASLEVAAADGLVAVGFFTYEAAPAFDPALVTQPPGALPVAWFALFDGSRETDLRPPGELAATRRPTWQPSVDLDRYRHGIARIREWIARGDTYQVNYTFRLRAAFDGEPRSFFESLAHRGGSRHGAYVDTGRHVLCSLSPELFLDLEGDRLLTRPMKGTAPRGRFTIEDERLAADLAASDKNRAENLMIVDMMRNDLGRIARPGSVDVSSLWEIERYPTLFQLTSTCEATTEATFGEILAALFPSASITGAPKVRTMQLIAGLEDSPRGIYTGAIGRFGPGRSARLNVAIRTVHVDRETGTAEYGTGGGVVWDSSADEEYRECGTKALAVTEPPPSFSLLETLRWGPRRGWVLLDRHLERLHDSAAYFDRPFDRDTVLEALGGAVHGAAGAQRVRLLVDASGEVHAAGEPLQRGPRRWTVALARRAVDATDRFLFHKTTYRAVYERARGEAVGDVDDVLLWNEERELTESTVANLVIRRAGELVTPPVECGLLAGTLRAELLARGRVREAVVRVDELAEAEAIFLVNSVRGWIPATLAQTPETRASTSP